MRTVKTYLIMVLLVIAGCTFADELNVANFTIQPGELKAVAVELNNSDRAYTLLEFTLTLPEGVSIAADGDGELLVVPNNARLKDSHMLDVAEIGDGTYKFLLYSSSNEVLTGNSGTILTMTLTASADAPIGNKEGVFSDQLFVDANKEGYEPADKAFNIRIGGIPGDVNKDSQISIADVTALVNIILGKDNTVPYLYDHDAANVNGDNTVSIADVTALVNIILGKQ